MHLQHLVSAGAVSDDIVSRSCRSSVPCRTSMQHCLPTRRPFFQTRSRYRSLTPSMGDIHGRSCSSRYCNDLRALLYVCKEPRSQGYNDGGHLRKLLPTRRVTAMIIPAQQRKHRVRQLALLHSVLTKRHCERRLNKLLAIHNADKFGIPLD